MYDLKDLLPSEYNNWLLYVYDDTRIDLHNLKRSLVKFGDFRQSYLVMLKNRVGENDNKNIVLGFYNSLKPLSKIIAHGYKQQVISNYVEENGILYLIIMIVNIGSTIEFYKLSDNEILFMNLK